MIFYFSGTGNSKYIANKMAELTSDIAIDIIGTNAEEINLSNEKQIGFVFPIYAWAAPDIMRDYIKKLRIKEGTYSYVAATCGTDCGMAMQKINRITKISAAVSLSMPNNYIMSGPTDSYELCYMKVTSSLEKLAALAVAVNNKERYFDLNRGALPRLKSSIVNWGFKKVAVTDKPFYVDKKCNSCGACEKLCPVGNIKLIDGNPTWNGNCIQCTACMNRCPVQAIQYTPITKRRGRYYFSESILEKKI